MNGLELPPEFLERIRDLEAGRTQPPVPKHAATVLLLRDRADGLEVFLLRRVSSMAFAPGAYVFPGGGVDARDAEYDQPGTDFAAWGAAFGAAEGTARALVCAAVRETFEEAHVLLAGPSPEKIVEDTGPFEPDRLALLDRSHSLAGFLDANGLVLRADLLRPWGHWITPVIEKRRYDTRFFVAALPEGQRARDVSTEADTVEWVRPADALERAVRGEIFMLPPTIAMLQSLTAHPTVADVLAAEHTFTVHEPAAKIIDGVPYLVLPDEASHHYGA
ncbi:NUDIX domain-containing protein [Actinocorallia sp. API 0066]|uniref:NUDIX hydrolase n=1 Tax=Actinocorallia sp. API 0066 TaxID=2896846 RepID=UPI001E61C2E9|nr:NUDIX domain-containing protein [Actinocorallia sp. API 0066]MCD0450646.1 NUDIX domain-containing protein [Actinocorallia sp. API 0066]